MPQESESKQYEQFVNRSLREVTLGLTLDNDREGSRKRKVRDALIHAELNSERSAAQKVLEARFMLGGDDASYLASGLACLWSTVAMNGVKEDDLALAPASLYAPDAVNGIRRGLLKALEQRNQELRREAPKELPRLLRLLLTIVDFVPDVPAETLDVLRSGGVTTFRQRARLVEFLNKLKAIMDDSEDSQDSQDSLARRILRGSMAQAKEVAQLKQNRERLQQRVQRLQVQHPQELARLEQGFEKLLNEERRRTEEQRKAFDARQKESGDALVAMFDDAPSPVEESFQKLNATHEANMARLVAELDVAKKALGTAKAEMAAAQAAAEKRCAEQVADARGKAGAAQQAQQQAQQQQAQQQTEAGKAYDELKRRLARAQSQLEQGRTELEQELDACQKKAGRAEVDHAAALNKVLLEKAQQAESLQARIEAASVAANQASDAMNAMNQVAEQKRQLQEALGAARDEALEAEKGFEEQVRELRERIKTLEAAGVDAKKLAEDEAGCNDRCELARKKLAEEQTARRNDLESKIELGEQEQLKITTELIRVRNAYSVKLDALQRCQSSQQQPADDDPERGERLVSILSKCGSDVNEATHEHDVQIAELNQQLQGVETRLKELKQARMVMAEEHASAKAEVWWAQKKWLDAKTKAVEEQEKDDDSDSTDATANVSGADFSQVAILRGMVGQRGPTESAWPQCAQDALLPYALPPLDAFARSAVPVRALLEASADPTDEEVRAALRTCEGHCAEPGAKRRKTEATTTRASPAVDAEAFSLLRDDYAITGTAPAAELAEDRLGVEVPHEVRWMPQGPRAEAMARVAVLEHAIARCVQVAGHADTGADAAQALRHAAASLKFGQMAQLYALNEAAEFDDHPHPLGTDAPLVTRPCAIVRGTLSFPTDAGVAPLTNEQLSEGSKPLSSGASLAQAMGKTAAATASLRNGLRRKGAFCQVYVAPPAHQLAFRSAVVSIGANLFDAPPPPELPVAPPVAPPAAPPAAPPVAPPAAPPEGDNQPAWLERAAQIINGAGQTRAANTAPPPPDGDNDLLRRNAQVPAETETALRLAQLVQARKAAAIARGEMANERLRPSDYSTDTWRRVINRAIVATGSVSIDGDAPDAPDATGAFLQMNAPATNGAGAVTAEERRKGLWTEMHRHLAISQDRLWIFIRHMSGNIGGDVSEVVTMANESTLRATKVLQEQRVDIAKRVSDMQSKIVETVVSSMLKNSKMTMDYKDDNLAVIDAEAQKDLKDLASGASGRPFFEANVALKNLTEKSDAAPSLKEVLSGLASVGTQMQTTLEQTLAEPSTGSASLIELSHPSNSYFVSIRPDAVAAIRTAHATLNAELGTLGGRRRIALWELVEGGCPVLTNRFAVLCGFVLVQARSTTGVSAMYISSSMMVSNASQARTALAKLVSAASVYAERVATPVFDHADTHNERCKALTAGEHVTDISITARSGSFSREPLFAPISNSGWVNVGGRR